jgi:hypothetical protein
MTSISATSGSNYQSPLQQLEAELQAEVNSGAVSSSDQNALSSALTDINASLQSGSAGDSSAAPNSPPGDLKSKIDTLIAGEVSSGKLTSDQATELQGIFTAAFANGAGGANTPADAGPSIGAGAAGGPRGAGHAHHGRPPPANNSSTTGSTGGSATSSASDILQQFLQSLQDSLSTSSSPSYGATGTSTGSNGSSSFSALLINYQT